jgi:hypothetical protein
LAGGSEANSLLPAPELVFVVVISAGTLFQAHGSKDVPHILLADITRMNTTCSNCGTELHPVFPEHDCLGNIQLIDALPVTFDGGYGMFYDDIDDNILSLVLCKNCAIALFDALPTLKNFVDSNHLGTIKEIET